MKITKLSVTLSQNHQHRSFKGWARIEIDDSFIVKGIMIYKRLNGDSYIRFPTINDGKGNEHIMFNVIDSDVRVHLTDTILAEYDRISE